MKSPNHLDRCIVCPQCGTKTMRLSVGKNPPAEYFDDHCHSYFTVCELVHRWGYDMGDFGDCYPISDAGEIYVRDGGRHPWEWLPDFTPIKVEEKIIATTWFDTVSTQVIDEPQFKSPSERMEAYEMVDRMIIGIPEWSMEDNSVDTGATHS